MKLLLTYKRINEVEIQSHTNQLLKGIKLHDVLLDGSYWYLKDRYPGSLSFYVEEKDCLNLFFVVLQQVMRGNHDGKSVVRHTFIPPVYARYIRVYPMAYRYRICMRMELYGCSNCKLSICVFSLSFLIKWKINGQASCQFCVCSLEWWHLIYDLWFITFYWAGFYSCPEGKGTRGLQGPIQRCPTSPTLPFAYERQPQHRDHPTLFE